MIWIFGSVKIHNKFISNNIISNKVISNNITYIFSSTPPGAPLIFFRIFLKKWLLNKTTLHKIIFSYRRKHENCKVGVLIYLTTCNMWKKVRGASVAAGRHPDTVGNTAQELWTPLPPPGLPRLARHPDTVGNTAPLPRITPLGRDPDMVGNTAQELWTPRAAPCVVFLFSVRFQASLSVLQTKNPTALQWGSLVARPRIELGTSWLWIMRSNHLSYRAGNWSAKVILFSLLSNSCAIFPD